ncbi:MAG TPA: hypothetical protein VGS08_03655 [Candidatus Saccharimonadales bacterium]|nr:hypothetical protein [Candidatus Saccharimonadales bacterium]
MAQCYFELRKQSARGSDSIIADMMRHLHTRQYIGRALVVCDQPTVMLSAARKQWLKLARTIQKQRASTLNADKILKYTHAIVYMQRLRFSSRSPLDDPEGDVCFVTPDQITVTPLQCFTIYLAAPIDREIMVTNLIDQLPAEALLVDYGHNDGWEKYGLQPKHLLEKRVIDEWTQVERFFTKYKIDIQALSTGTMGDVEAMDDALDTVLGISHQFLQIANSFQHALEIARPLHLSQHTRRQYDALSLLAHRVQALSSEAFTQRFLEAYNEDDTFFLYDATRQVLFGYGESLAEAVGRHLQAGRANLAIALRRSYMGRSLSPMTKPI